MELATVLNVDIPLIQAPMAGAQNWELAVAVARAGALGSIPCGALSAAQVVAEIEQFRRHCAGPYNLNFFCHAPGEADATQLRIWQGALGPYYRELGLAPGGAAGARRRPFDSALAGAVEVYAPPVVSFHFGLPEPALLGRVKSWGATVLSSATTVEEGRWLERHGADVVIAQGYEAGGHRAMFLSDDLAGQLGSLALTSQLVRELAVPVVAAGGIASRRDIDALLQLGAAGVQVGTSYLLCRESAIRAVHRRALREQTGTTALTNVFSGRPARGIRNRLMRELGDMCELAPDFPHAAAGLAPLREAAEAAGVADFSPLWCGQNRSGCREVSATEMTRMLWQQ